MPDIESYGGQYMEEQGTTANPSESREDALQSIRTAGTLSISPELFEKLYLTPKTPTKVNLRAMMGNPSAL